MRRRLLVGAAATVIVLVGLAVAYVLRVRHEQRDIRGSSTVEFVPTLSISVPPKLTGEKVKVVWPMLRARRRAADGSRPGSRWRPHSGARGCSGPGA